MFPKTEIGLQKWLQCINCERLKSLSFRKNDLRKDFVCAKHFEKRQQISALKHEHLKEIKCIKGVLEGLRCSSCAEQATSVEPIHRQANSDDNPNSDCIPFRPIGVIRTTFYNKRGVPRQASIVANSKGTVEIDTSVFNNPEHAMYGLEEFSHMWIMFHFHVTESNSVPAMVAPPRLSGERRGVFSTRSPHRPCPIGLSLVKITKIEGNKIHFLGVDMVNGTPVLDVKPYIPQYDHPSYIGDRPPTEGIDNLPNLLQDQGSISSRVTAPIGVETSPTTGSPFEEILTPDMVRSTSTNSPVDLGSREDYERGAPDGQEHFTQNAPTTDSQANVRIPAWINNPPAQVFEVTFTTEAYDRLKELIGNRAEGFKTNIQSLLSEDPRSHYVRTRYPDHEFSCVLEDLSISCIFDAESSVCTIITVRNAEEMQQA